jgi:hypothetical protein
MFRPKYFYVNVDLYLFSHCSSRISRLSKTETCIESELRNRNTLVYAVDQESGWASVTVLPYVSSETNDLRVRPKILNADTMKIT